MNQPKKKFQRSITLGLILIGMITLWVIYTINAIDKHHQKIHSQVQKISQSFPEYLQTFDTHYGHLPGSIQQEYQALKESRKALNGIEIEAILNNKKMASLFSDHVKDYFQKLSQFTDWLQIKAQKKSSEIDIESWQVFIQESNKVLLSLHKLSALLESYEGLLNEGSSSWINYFFNDQEPFPTISTPNDYIKIIYLDQ